MAKKKKSNRSIAARRTLQRSHEISSYFKQKGIKNVGKYLDALLEMMYQRCPEYYDATAEEEKQRVLKKYEEKDRQLGLLMPHRE